MLCSRWIRTHLFMLSSINSLIMPFYQATCRIDSQNCSVSPGSGSLLLFRTVRLYLIGPSVNILSLLKALYKCLILFSLTVMQLVSQ